MNLEPLHAIRDVTHACSRAGIDHWLFGGWAIDFHLGMVTRDHNDIDLIIWSHDKAKLMVTLQRASFEQGEEAPEHIYFEKYHQRIEVSFIERASNGEIVTPGRWEQWPWTPEAFHAGTRILLGVECPVTSIESILESKRDFQMHAPNEPLRDKDVQDLIRVHSNTQNSVLRRRRI